MSMDIKLSKTQIFQITKPSGFIGSWLGKISKKSS